MIHKQPHPLAGKFVKTKATCVLLLGHIPKKIVGPVAFEVEDWWDRLSGKSWGDCVGNPACLAYAVRTGLFKENQAVPSDDEVLYGKVGDFGHLIHVSELEL